MEDMRKKLFFEKKNGYERIGREDQLHLEEYAGEYMCFLNECRTEREAVETAIEMAEQAGFVQQSGALTGGEDNTITVTLPADAKPGYYPFTILFDSENNGTFECTGELAIYYSSSLIRQRWDDVLGILNAEYNGGYDFQSFRWYRNGVAIEGATEPYLYVEDKLKPGDIYTVELSQEGELRPLMTCGYTVSAQQQSPAATTSIKMIQGGEMYIYVNGQIYNAQGVRVR